MKNENEKERKRKAINLFIGPAGAGWSGAITTKWW
jgi:hypothetical protein